MRMRFWSDLFGSGRLRSLAVINVIFSFSRSLLTVHKKNNINININHNHNFQDFTYVRVEDIYMWLMLVGGAFRNINYTYVAEITQVWEIRCSLDVMSDLDKNVLPDWTKLYFRLIVYKFEFLPSLILFDRWHFVPWFSSRATNNYKKMA